MNQESGSYTVHCTLHCTLCFQSNSSKEYFSNDYSS